MFRGLINDAKSAASSLVVRYLARASVAVPFVIAFGFAVAAVTLMLVERYGPIAAYWMVAAGFTIFGVLAAIFVSMKQHQEDKADAVAKERDTQTVATDSMAQAAVQMPLALLGTLATTPGAIALLGGGAKTLGRNVPLVALLATIAFILWPSGPPIAEEAVDPDARPDGPVVARGAGERAHPIYPPPNGRHRDAA